MRTNVDFLLWALHEPSFLNGSYTTKTIESEFKPDRLPNREEELDLAAVAAAIAAFNYHSTVRHTSVESESSDAWRRAARLDGTRRWSR